MSRAALPDAALVRLAAVIPALDEARTIREVVVGVLRHVERVIVVDDGSTDGTARALDGLPVVVLRNAHTLGKAASLKRGVARALEGGACAVVTLDADGQHAPEDIPRLVAAHRTNPRAIVVGARLRERQRMPVARHRANRFANFWIAWAAGRPLADTQSGFRIYPAAVLRELGFDSNRSTRFVFESEILIDASRAGVDIVFVAIAAIYAREARPSHFRPVVDIALITRMVAWKLVKRGLDLPGLVKSLGGTPPREYNGDSLERRV